jgi:hypothetical protein
MKGPKKEDGTRAEAIRGMKDLDCEACDRSGPNRGEELKQLRGCRRYGLTYVAGGGEGRYRYDFTGDARRDFCNFCPASLGDPRVQKWIYRALEIEALGGLDRVAKRPIYHLPARVIDFYLAARGARDRFTAELEAAEASLFSQG